MAFDVSIAGRAAAGRLLPPPRLDLSGRGALVLQVAGVQYPLARFSAAFRLNAVPQAQCVLAVGRDAGGAASAAHTRRLPEGDPEAVVYFAPAGTRGYGAAGPRSDWPGSQVCIFRGRLAGGFRPVRGADASSLSAVLVHWLGDLGGATAAAGGLALGGPADLAAAAALRVGGDSFGPSALTAQGLGLATTFGPLARRDLWAAVKLVHRTLAANPARVPVPGWEELFAENRRAVAALDRIEGPAGDSGGDYTYAAALSLAGLPGAAQSEAVRAVAEEALAAYGGASFWDKLVGQLGPLFGLAVAPLVDSALVLPDAPYRRALQVWKTITVDEYGTAGWTPAARRPARGVGVVARFGLQSFAPGRGRTAAAGTFVAPGTGPGDGELHFVAPRPWLAAAAGRGADPELTGGAAGNQPVPALGGVAAAGPSFAPDLREAFGKWARDAFHHLTLRDRVGSVVCPLRFDIAPGSLVRLKRVVDPRLGAADVLAEDRVGSVTGVAVVVDAEGPPTTTLELSHLRTSTEDASDKWSWADGHPVFAMAGRGYGAPLVPELDPDRKE